jgi:leucyl-tRNA synthetase
LTHLDQGTAGAIDVHTLSDASRDLRRKLHETIGKIESDIHDRQSFNTAIAALMELSNAIGKFDASNDAARAVERDALINLLILLAPFAPHLSQTLLARFDIDLMSAAYPAVDPAALTKTTQTIVVQVNGKLRGKLDVAVDISDDDLKALAKALPELQAYLTGPTKKEIVVKNKLVNLVV